MLDMRGLLYHNRTACTHGHNSIGILPAKGQSPVCSHMPTIVSEAGFCV